jgi:hypothetical protein
MNMNPNASFRCKSRDWMVHLRCWWEPQYGLWLSNFCIYAYSLPQIASTLGTLLITHLFVIVTSIKPLQIPYFEEVQAIIFLAPLAFNQVLEEDPRVNRLVCIPSITWVHYLSICTTQTGRFYKHMEGNLHQSSTLPFDPHSFSEQGAFFGLWMPIRWHARNG